MAGQPLTPSPRLPLIFLIGPRGSGKSRVARLLAGRSLRVRGGGSERDPEGEDERPHATYGSG